MPLCGMGLIGIVGIAYSGMIAHCMRGLTAYRPQGEDWLFHVALPAIAYATFAFSAAISRFEMRAAMFTVAGTVLLLLFMGIHNAWDAVTYYVFTRIRKQAKVQDAGQGQ